MIRFSTLILAASVLSCTLAGCEDDSPPPIEWPRRDGSVPDASSPIPDGGGEEPVDRTCTVQDDLVLGEPELYVLPPDRVHVAPRPGTSDEFVLVTAQEICPAASCDGGVGEGSSGGDDWSRRRAVLYAFSGSGAPTGPTWVNLGVGELQHTDVRAPALAPVGNRLVVAWLDPTIGEDNRIDVWTQAVNASTLAPIGSMTKASNAARSARRLVLVPGSSSATAIYEDFEQGSAPTLHAVEISADGEPGTPADLGTLVESADAHAGLRLAGGGILFGFTEPSTGGVCDFLVGDPYDLDTALTVQEDEATRSCGDVALAPGGAAFAAQASGASVIQFRPLTENGEPTGREVRVAGKPGKGATHPALARFAGGFFLAYVQSGFGIPTSLRGATLTSAGTVQEDVELVAELGNDVATPTVAVAADGSAIAVAWKERGADNRLETRLVRLTCR